MKNRLLNKRKVKFGVFESALASLLFVIYNFLFVQVVLAVYPNGVPGETFSMFVVQFLLEAVFAVTAITVALSKKVGFVKATGLKKRINVKLVLLALGVAFVSLYGFGNVTTVFLEILQICGYKSVLRSISITTFWQYLGYVIASCVAPAICEELLFRGTILSGLKEYGLKVAVIVSAVIFTFMHGSAEQTVHQFIIGILVGYIFFKTGNLWIGIVVHFFNNFISVTQAYVASFQKAATEAVQITPMSFVVDVIVACIMCYVGWIMMKWLIGRILIEDAKLNTDEEPLMVDKKQAILVDGEEVVTEVVLEGAENVADSDMAEASGVKEEPEKKPLSAGVIVMFALSGCYLLFEWIANLLVGFGVI